MKALKRHKALAWICSSCKVGLSKAASRCSCCTRLESKIGLLEEALSEQAKLIMKVYDGQEQLARIVNSSHQMLESTVIEQENTVKRLAKDDEKRQASYADIVRGSCVEVIESITSKIETLPKDQGTASKPSQQIAGIVDSVLDKEKRKKNIVVHNLPEAMAETHADRMNKDKSSFVQLVKDEFRLSVKVTNCFRAGKVVTGKHRLLIVTLDDEETKWEIICHASQLRHSDRWPRVYLTPDLTRSEREEGRKLRKN